MMQTHQSFVNMCSRLMLLSLLLVATAPMGRGGEASAQERETMSEAATPRVFFMSPKEGEEFRFFEFGVYESPVVFEFGVENYEIAAVPKEVGQVRSGIGHYHIGVDTECLSPGEVIPRGGPWEHFDNGSARTEKILEEPGEFTFVLQVGDDEHLAKAGLCATVTIEIGE